MELIFSTKLQVQGLQLYQKMLLYKYFPKFLLRFVVFYKDFLEILQTYVSQKTFQQQLLAATDYGLRKPKILSVSNGNLIVLKWQNIRYFKPKIYCNINQKLAKQFTLHSAEAFSEPFQTSKQGVYLFGGNYFRKKLHLRCLTRF